MKKFNLKKAKKNPESSVMCKAGNPVRLICFDRTTKYDNKELNPYPVLGLELIGEDNEVLRSYKQDGTFCNYSSGCDLVMVSKPKFIVRWANAYPDNLGKNGFSIRDTYKTKKEAIGKQLQTSLGTVKIKLRKNNIEA